MDAFEATIYNAILISAIVLGGIITYFGIAVFRNQRKYLKKHNEQLLAAHDILENERTRIARDLHDELGPILGVTRIQIGAGEKHEMHLENADKNILKVIERLSGIAKNLTPRTLVKHGLFSALNEFFDQLKDLDRTRVSFSWHVTSGIGEYMSLHLYRIIHEMVHNGIKHAGASHIDIIFHERRNIIYIQYRDDGSGFSPDSSQKSTGLGLVSLKSRVTTLGGSMQHIVSDSGTEYFFEIPLRLKYG